MTLRGESLHYIGFKMIIYQLLPKPRFDVYPFEVIFRISSKLAAMYGMNNYSAQDLSISSAPKGLTCSSRSSSPGLPIFTVISSSSRPWL